MTLPRRGLLILRTHRTLSVAVVVSVRVPLVPVMMIE
jgi:hypothetical protein